QDFIKPHYPRAKIGKIPSILRTEPFFTWSFCNLRKIDKITTELPVARSMIRIEKDPARLKGKICRQFRIPRPRIFGGQNKSGELMKSPFQHLLIRKETCPTCLQEPARVILQ